MSNKHLENLKRKKEELEKQIAEEEAKVVSKEGVLKFFCFQQNNSGGFFNVTDKLCHNLYIEAHSYNEAREKATDMGVYFNGCDIGIDCSCCGDRWDDYADEINLTELSNSCSIKFEKISDYAQYMADEFGWTIPDARIFYYDGTVTEIFANKIN